MARQDGATPRALELQAQLHDAPYKFDFFQAVRRLECAFRDHPRVGESLRPTDDPFRLAQQPTMAFAPSTISSFKNGASGFPPRLSTYFLGLLGPNGPLPLHLTEFAHERKTLHGDHTFARFLDIFHHRMLSLFYRAWADAQPTVSLDRPENNRVSAFLGALFGIGMDSLRDRDAIPDMAKLHHAGWFSGHTRCGDGLEAILNDYFAAPAKVLQFVGHWVRLPRDCQLRLGESPDTGTLGETATVGARVWDCQTKFRVVLGPLGFEEYESFLPGGEELVHLIAAIRNYIGDELLWDVNLILKKEETPPLALGQQGQLGWTTWLASRPLPADPADLCLLPIAEGEAA